MTPTYCPCGIQIDLNRSLVGPERTLAGSSHIRIQTLHHQAQGGTTRRVALGHHLGNPEGLDRAPLGAANPG